MSKVIVVGGGAAGMMAALTAAGKGHRVTLYEKNEKLGKKLFITGKGRCNVTNACDVEELFGNVVHNAKFLYSAFYGFDNKAVMSLLEQAGCPVKTERGERVFPVSDHSSDVVRALKKLLDERRVELCLRTDVKKLLVENGAVRGILLPDGAREPADAVILATGGLSYPSTGSTGDGFRMAKACGHRLVEREPSLVPLTVREEWCRELAGLSLRNIKALLQNQKSGKILYSGFGEMLFTHFGVSGPLILSASSYYGRQEREEGCVLSLDLKPALTEDQLDRRILRDFEENRNKQFKNAVNSLFPVRLIPVMIEVSGIYPDKKINEVTKEERRRFVYRIKHWEMTVTGTRGFEEAVITRGGVSVKDVNPSTMESRRISGLYFAGEVLDLDALTGGYNLQIAWSTGALAGESIP